MSENNASLAVEYRAIPNYPGYLVGDDGSIWSCRMNRRKGVDAPWRKLKLRADRDGYLSVKIKNKDGYWGPRVHRLVLSVFIGPCPSGMICAHNNGIRDDNRLENLRWDTQKGNCADKKIHGTNQSGSKHPHAILNESDVWEIFEMRNQGLLIKDISLKKNISTATIHAIFQRRQWKHVSQPPQRHPSVKKQRQMIRTLRNGGYTHAKIAKAIGLSRSSINGLSIGQHGLRLKYEILLERLVASLH